MANLRSKDYGAIFIYALTDPRDGRIRYVGKARDPVERHKQHSRGDGRRGRNHRSAWLANLAALDLRPGVVVLDAVPMCEWRAAESRWILALRAKGYDLVNGTDGGDGVPDGWLRSASSDLAKRTTRLSREVSDARRGKLGQEPWASSYAKAAGAIVAIMKMIHQPQGHLHTQLRPGIDRERFRSAKALAVALWVKHVAEHGLEKRLIANVDR